MKKRINELVRIQSVIENDRLNTGDSFEELLLSDVHKILSDYFDYRGVPNLKLTRESRSIYVEIQVSALAIKNFTTIPKQVSLKSNFELNFSPIVIVFILYLKIILTRNLKNVNKRWDESFYMVFQNKYILI